MRTPVVSRRTVQVETLAEIVQEESAPPAQKIYVAVGKDLSESAHALKWALLNLERRQAAFIILLHINPPLRYMPSPMGKIPLNQVSKDVLKAYKRDEEKELNSCMNKYLDMCTRAKVKAERLIIEKEEVSKGIVEVVSELGITKLVMGTTSAGGAIPRKMKMQAEGKAYYVQRHAIESCDVSIVCKGKLVLLREGSPLHNGPKSKSNRNSLSGWLWKRPEASIVKPSTDDFVLSVSSTPNFGQNLDNLNQIPSNFQPDSMGSWTEKVDDLEMTAVIDEFSSQFEAADSPYIDVDQTYDVEREPPESLEANTDSEVPKLELIEALEAVVNAKKEVQDEIARRKRAEAAAIISIHKYKNLEATFKETAKEKEEVTSRLRLSEQNCQDLTRRRNQVEEEIQKMVKKLTSLEAKVNQCSREQQEAMQEAQATRQKLAAVEEQNYSILQEKEHEIQQLQNCLLSMPRVEIPASSSSSSNNLEFREYSLDAIKEATCDFSDDFKLGEGGYGDIYKGEIRQTTVAVKIRREDSLQGRQEFQREIDIFRDIRHPHLVRIVGSCSERGCIIYEYMSNGCLADRLSCKDASPPLPWYTRFRIAAEISSALQYLHSFSPDPIVHCDLKPQNILLDENYVSKVSDFGLARPLPKDLRSESEPKGTFSYMDPEYLRSGEYSTKSDVYSLGIVILQLLTGKPALGLVKEVERALDSAKLDKILDPSAGDWPFVQAIQLAYLALHCTDPDRKKRPDVEPTVMKMLNQLRNMFPASNPGRLVESGQKSGQAAKEIHVPSFFLCPIFKEVMRDPYIAADGFTYEKEAIQGWFDCGRKTSPMTNKKLVSKNLIQNFSLRSAIREWQERGDLL